MNIAPGREPSFIVLFLAQFVFFLVVLISQNDHTGWIAVQEIGKDLSRLVLLMTAISYVGVESATMIAEAFLKKREEKGEEKGRDTNERNGRNGWTNSLRRSRKNSPLLRRSIGQAVHKRKGPDESGPFLLP